MSSYCKAYYQGQYTYNIHGCSQEYDPNAYGGLGGCVTASSISSATYSTPQNTAVIGSQPWCTHVGGGSVPSGCNQGYQPGIPTPTPIQISGPPNPVCTAQSGPCAVVHQGNLCTSVPCNCKAQCGCDTSTCGGTPTPTPTPPPSCTLSCPGEYLSGSDFDENVLGTTTLLAQSAGNPGGGNSVDGGTGLVCGTSTQTVKSDSNTKYGFGVVEGDLTFLGENGFICDELRSCTEDPTECPTPTVISGGNDSDVSGGSSGGSSTKGVMTQVLGATSDNPVVQKTPLGKVLGTATTLLAQAANPGGGNTSPGGSGYTTTWTTSVRVNRLEGSDTTVHSFQAADASNRSCSCNIVLGCFESLQDSPNSAEAEVEACESECTFTFDAASEYPTTTDNVHIDIDANSGYDSFVALDWDDGVGLQEITGSTTADSLLINSGTYDVRLVCRDASSNEKTCTRRLSVYCEGTDTGTLPTPTPTPPAAWMKLKDSTFHAKTSINNPAPTGAEFFDEDDRGVCDSNDPSSFACISSGDAGAVVVEGPSSEFGTRLSDREWLRTDTGYSINSLLTPSSFIEYVRARKEYTEIDGIETSDIQPDTINIYDGSTTIDDNSIPDFLAVGQTLVLVVDGNLTIDMASEVDNTFNRDNKPIAILVTGQINITEGTTEMNGIFVGNTIDFASDAFPITTAPLKVNGNISSVSTLTSSCHEQRQRDDNQLQPSCFFTFDFANQFLPLVEMLSTRTYEWTELVP